MAEHLPRGGSRASHMISRLSDGSHLSRNTTYCWLSVSDLLVPSYLELWQPYCFSLSFAIMPATLLIQILLLHHAGDTADTACAWTGTPSSGHALLIALLLLVYIQ
jgi:hypothetical protein